MRSKLFLIIFTLILSFGFTACKLGGESNYSPRIAIVNPAYINIDSVLAMKITQEGNIAFDSLHVNDTVTVFVTADSFSNKLKTFDYVIPANSGIELLVVDTIAKYFDPSSDFQNGRIRFYDNTAWMNYPFKFVAKEARDKVKIEFMITSDAANIPNDAGLILEFPIKP